MTRRARPTIVDVARVAGVSPTTVSYVLSGPRERAARISTETAERIRDAARDLGYVPNHSARTLRRRHTDRVLFLGSRLSSLYSQAMAQSIERALVRHGLSLGIHIGSSSEHVERAITALRQGRADGLIIETSDAHVPELRAAAADGHAIVAIGPMLPEATFDVISSDIAPAVREAMEHLIERQYPHMILMSSCDDAADDHRIRIAHQHLLARGVPETHITVLHCPHDRVAAHDAALAFLADGSRPIAVYAGADVSAIGVLWAAQRLGLRVPDEVGIVGHGNTPETQITVPSLTSLGPVSTDFGKAAELMASRLGNRSLPGRHLAEPYHLTVRESTQITTDR